MTVVGTCWKCCAELDASDFGISDPGETFGELASAIRRGDTAEAEQMLDRLAEFFPDGGEAVARGRYSNRARAA